MSNQSQNGKGQH